MTDTAGQSSKQRICPECDYKFQGVGWTGIDAHWRSKHEDVMSYEEAWQLLRHDRYLRTGAAK